MKNKKKMLASFTAAAMMMGQYIPVKAESVMSRIKTFTYRSDKCTIQLIPDHTDVKPGDLVTYTIEATRGARVPFAFELDMEMPDTLEFVSRKQAFEDDTLSVTEQIDKYGTFGGGGYSDMIHPSNNERRANISFIVSKPEVFEKLGQRFELGEFTVKVSEDAQVIDAPFFDRVIWIDDIYHEQTNIDPNVSAYSYVTASASFSDREDEIKHISGELKAKNETAPGATVEYDVFLDLPDGSGDASTFTLAVPDGMTYLGFDCDSAKVCSDLGMELVSVSDVNDEKEAPYALRFMGFGNDNSYDTPVEDYYVGTLKVQIAEDATPFELEHLSPYMTSLSCFVDVDEEDKSIDYYPPEKYPAEAKVELISAGLKKEVGSDALYRLTIDQPYSISSLFLDFDVPEGLSIRGIANDFDKVYEELGWDREDYDHAHTSWAYTSTKGDYSGSPEGTYEIGMVCVEVTDERGLDKDISLKSYSAFIDDKDLKEPEDGLEYVRSYVTFVPESNTPDENGDLRCKLLYTQADKSDAVKFFVDMPEGMTMTGFEENEAVTKDLLSYETVICNNVSATNRSYTNQDWAFFAMSEDFLSEAETGTYELGTVLIHAKEGVSFANGVPLAFDVESVRAESLNKLNAVKTENFTKDAAVTFDSSAVVQLFPYTNRVYADQTFAIEVVYHQDKPAKLIDFEVVLPKGADITDIRTEALEEYVGITGCRIQMTKIKDNVVRVTGYVPEGMGQAGKAVLGNIFVKAGEDMIGEFGYGLGSSRILCDACGTRMAVRCSTDILEVLPPKSHDVDDEPTHEDDQTTSDGEDNTDEREVGDINGDGEINVTDLTILCAHVKSIRAVAQDSEYYADVNGDGDLNVSDVTKLAAHVKGIRPLKSS
ncbi:dockerin type I repeat-containing protein [Ruminococcus sp.]|uniref:dockerin type I repeat-containing protein n=1 Tax=Ruminococcus sp. TaxID=41978 RepID=UPI0025D49E3F|nr:dockerin type I repeat-containing protein [Ruminococcus sp.]MBQ8967834.1 dockerin type I repeat-containing protein [Ruminococcus sp.]